MEMISEDPLSWSAIYPMKVIHQLSFVFEFLPSNQGWAPQKRGLWGSIVSPLDLLWWTSKIFWYERALNVNKLSSLIASLGRLVDLKKTHPGVSCCLHLILVGMETLYLNLHHSYTN